MTIIYNTFFYNGHRYYVGRRNRKYAHKAVARSLKTLKLKLRKM